MKLAVLFSGGKDSYLALQYASMEHDISCLLTLDSKREDSWNTVFLGKIKDEKSSVFPISKLLEESLWLSVATPDKKVLFPDLVLCKKIPLR